MQTVITTFETDPGACQDLVDALSAAYEGFIRAAPGFRGASLHVNDAQTRVAIRSHWDDRDAFKAHLRSDRMKDLSRRLAPHYRNFEPVLYDVVAEFAPA